MVGKGQKTRTRKRQTRTSQQVPQGGTFGEKTPLGRILHNFWLRMRTPKGTPECTTTIVRRKTMQGKAGHAQNILPGLVRVSSGHVTSCSITTSLHYKCCLSCAHILLTYPLQNKNVVLSPSVPLCVSDRIFNIFRKNV